MILMTAKHKYHDSALLLSDSRKKAAIKLSKMITKSMAELNMPHGKFFIDICQDKHDNLSVNGYDHVSYLRQFKSRSST